MPKEPTLTRRKARKKVSNFMCRRGKHEWVDVGGFDSSEGAFAFQWCTTCGCLEETNSDGEVKIRVPDTGI